MLLFVRIEESGWGPRNPYLVRIEKTVRNIGRSLIVTWHAFHQFLANLAPILHYLTCTPTIFRETGPKWLYFYIAVNKTLPPLGQFFAQLAQILRTSNDFLRIFLYSNNFWWKWSKFYVQFMSQWRKPYPHSDNFWEYGPSFLHGAMNTHNISHIFHKEAYAFNSLHHHPGNHHPH